MKEKEDDSLMKSRSARSVVAAAFRLYSGNFRRLFRAAWLAALLFAIAECLLGTINACGPSNYFLLTLMAIVIVVGGLVELMTYSVGLDMLKVHATTGKMPLTASHFPKKTYWRTLKAFLSLLLVEVPIIFVFAMYFVFVLYPVLPDIGNHMVLAAATLLGILVCAILELPFAHVAMRYIMNEEIKFWKSFWQSYKAGLAHIGHIFVVVFINFIILFIVQCIISLPALILQIASMKALAGEAMGDPLGMPSYRLALCAVTFLVCGFFQPFIRMPSVFSFYYMYGAIETSEAEKKQFKTNIEQK